MLKIMIVDDERLIRMGLIKTIRRKFPESEFCEAQDGEEALRKYEDFLPELVITDVKMSGMDGIRLTSTLRERRIDVPIVIVSGFNDFSYAKSAMRYGVNDYLLKPIDEEELFEAVEKAMEKKREELGFDHDNAAYIEACSYFRSLISEDNSHRPLPGAFTYKNYFIAVSYIYDIAKYHPERLNTALIIRMLQQGMWKEMKCVAFEVNAGEIICVTNMNDADTGRVQKCLEAVLLEIRSQMGCAVSFGACARAVNGTEIIAAYKEACMAALYRIYDENIPLFCMSPDEKEQEKDEREWNEMEGQIVRCVAEDNHQKCKLLLEQMFEIVIRSKLCPRIFIDRICMLLDKINVQLTKMNQGFEMRFSAEKNRIQVLCRCERINIIEKYVQEIFDNIFQLLKTLNKNECKRIINKAQQYIVDCGGINVTLKSCSQYISLNAAYFSYLFKRETGDNFVNFVTRVKLKKAAEMLVEKPELRIYEIAYQLGYDDVKYFNRVFKKEFYISPGEYRERNSESVK